ncbi:uncharacterized protein LOC126736032 [Anthonomus grandis grandis]|uniref:uncharacterized protein LOC126736032 n=1 Tax=Anthonomus grandis grandis TaxID=2921223 RepID=UPI002165A519|nr:uncharacterized protein LOC126736032 [Anthonomus grandis grandis]
MLLSDYLKIVLPYDHITLRLCHITLSKLEDNPGILPIKLGHAKIRDFEYNLIHVYDLNPIMLEMNKLHRKSINITTLLIKHPQYLPDNYDYLKILDLIQNRVENKLKELVPHPNRMKRGLINIVGSAIKVITGNLDAADGERYDHLIDELQKNDNKLSQSVMNQNSLILSVIKKFNNTILQIAKREEMLEFRINQIADVLKDFDHTQNSNNIRNILDALVNVYEFIDSTLQDLENSITFAKLKTMHPSIIKTTDLFNDLKQFEQRVGSNQLPIKIELENMLLIEKIIKISSYILNNRITFILHVPVTFNENFEIFHLYAAPVLVQSRFKVILPRNKYIIKNKLHYAYQSQACQEVSTQLFLCDKSNLQDVQESSPCEVQLLSYVKSTSICSQIQVVLNHIIINQLASSNNWLFVLPKEALVLLKCQAQEEEVQLIGSYMVNIPNNCLAKVNELIITNDDKPTNFSPQPLLFPDLNKINEPLPLLNLSFTSTDVKLDELQELQSQIVAIDPSLEFPRVPAVPSFWTILIYIMLVTGISYLCYAKLRKRYCAQKECQEDNQQSIQLP